MQFKKWVNSSLKAVRKPSTAVIASLGTVAAVITAQLAKHIQGETQLTSAEHPVTAELPSSQVVATEQGMPVASSEAVTGASNSTQAKTVPQEKSQPAAKNSVQEKADPKTASTEQATSTPVKQESVSAEQNVTQENTTTSAEKTLSESETESSGGGGSSAGAGILAAVVGLLGAAGAGLAMSESGGSAGAASSSTGNSNGGSNGNGNGNGGSSNSVNHAPQGADATITVNEDTSRPLTVNDFGFSDPAETSANSFIAVVITSIPSAGSLTLNGVAVVAGQSISIADINNNLLVYTPEANANGLSYADFTFQVRDNGGTANGGVDLDSTPNHVVINVVAVNDAPEVIGAIADQAVATGEDFSYAIDTTAFRDIDGDTLTYVVTDENGNALPAWLHFDPATMTLSGTPVDSDVGSVNVKVTVSDSVSEVSTQFTVQVNQTIVPNTAPNGTDADITIYEDTPRTLTEADFGFSDSNSPANSLAAVVITTLPTEGSLTLNGVAVTAGQSISVADINNNLLVFTPDTNFSGMANFTFQVQDNGGTANGGVDLDPTPNTAVISVSPINDAPEVVGTIPDQATATGENFNYTIDRNVFRDVDSSFLNYVVTDENGNALPAWLHFDPTTMTLSGTPVDSDVGSVNVKVTVSDSVSEVSTQFTVQVNQTIVSNTAPNGTDADITIYEDTPRTLTEADFGFSDSNFPAHTLSAVIITTLPSVGSLTLNGAAVTAGQSISVADINNNLLVFTPDTNFSGMANFTFQVQDNGGTANGGVDLDPTPNTAVISVSPINDAPEVVGTIPDQATATGENFNYTIDRNVFRDVDSSFLNYVVTDGNGNALPTWLHFNASTMTLSGTPVNGDVGVVTIRVTASDSVSEVSTQFTVQVNQTIVPNTAPNGADADITIYEDTPRTLTEADFGFSDSNSPAHTLSAVIITTLPTEGSLTLNGVAVTAGQSISIVDINSNSLVFTPDENFSGTANFNFQVQDNGGTANGGVDLDPTPNTAVINVLAVNDAPEVTGTIPDQASATGEDFEYTIDRGMFTDVDSNFLLYKATDENGDPLPVWLQFDAATLKLSGNLIEAGDFTIKITATDFGGESVSTQFALHVEQSAVTGTEDNDQDGIYDEFEDGEVYNTSSTSADSDGDGISDLWESVRHTDDSNNTDVTQQLNAVPHTNVGLVELNSNESAKVIGGLYNVGDKAVHEFTVDEAGHLSIDSFNPASDLGTSASQGISFEHGLIESLNGQTLELYQLKDTNGDGVNERILLKVSNSQLDYDVTETGTYQVEVKATYAAREFAAKSLQYHKGFTGDASSLTAAMVDANDDVYFVDEQNNITVKQDYGLQALPTDGLFNGIGNLVMEGFQTLGDVLRTAALISTASVMSTIITGIIVALPTTLAYVSVLTTVGTGMATIIMTTVGFVAGGVAAGAGGIFGSMGVMANGFGAPFSALNNTGFSSTGGLGFGVNTSATPGFTSGQAFTIGEGLGPVNLITPLSFPAMGGGAGGIGLNFTLTEQGNALMRPDQIQVLGTPTIVRLNDTAGSGDVQSILGGLFGSSNASQFYTEKGLYGLNFSLVTDQDKDGINDRLEQEQYHTDPNSVDTDNDGLSDALEIQLGLDARDADTDDDGLSDGEELNGFVLPSGVETHTDPRSADTDGDGIVDGIEAGRDTGIASGTNQNGYQYAGTDSENSQPVFGAGDADTSTWSNPNSDDTDGGYMKDGEEDANKNGRVDANETNPNAAQDDFIKPDQFDVSASNDTKAQAAALPQWQTVNYDINNPTPDFSYISLSNLSLDDAAQLHQGSSGKDVDWYSFTVEDNGWVTVKLGYNHNFGAIKVDLYDADNHLVATNVNLNNGLEKISLEIGAYYLKIEGASGASRHVYSLTLEHHADSDLDYVSNQAEREMGSDPYSDDSDNDGLSDFSEIYLVRMVNSDVDTDGDKTPNYIDEDSDNDGLLDGVEASINGTAAYSADFDQDGVADNQEVNVAAANARHYKVQVVDLYSDPTKADTDGDGVNDSQESFAQRHIYNGTVASGVSKDFAEVGVIVDPAGTTHAVENDTIMTAYNVDNLFNTQSGDLKVLQQNFTLDSPGVVAINDYGKQTTLSSGDQDWYRFTVNDSYAVVTLDVSGLVGTSYKLYDQYGKEVKFQQLDFAYYADESNQDSQPLANYITTLVPADQAGSVFYLSISGMPTDYTPNSTVFTYTGNYAVTLSVQEQHYDATDGGREANDTVIGAPLEDVYAAVDNTITFDGMLLYNGLDEDYFRVHLQEGAVLTVVNDYGLTGLLSMEAVNGNGNIVAVTQLNDARITQDSNGDYFNRLTMAVTAQTTGDYLITVDSFANYIAAYNLKLTVQDAYEGSTKASPYAVDDLTYLSNLNLHAANDQDWFSVRLEAGEMLDLQALNTYIDSNGMQRTVNIELYDSQDRLVAVQDDAHAAFGSDQLLFYAVAGDDYKIKVSTDQGLLTKYDLSINKAGVGEQNLQADPVANNTQQRI